MGWFYAEHIESYRRTGKLCVLLLMLGSTFDNITTNIGIMHHGLSNEGNPFYVFMFSFNPSFAIVSNLVMSTLGAFCFWYGITRSNDYRKVVMHSIMALFLGILRVTASVGWWFI